MPTPSMRRAFVRATELLTQAKLRTLADVRGAVSVRGKVWFHGGGQLILGDGVVLDGGVCGIELCVRRGAVLALENATSIGPGTSIEAFTRIQLGEGSRVGAACKLLDNHLHSLAGERHTAPKSVPMLVEPEAVVEDYAILLPGARLGRGARVGRGAVVSRYVPAGASVPARAVHASREFEGRP